MASQKKELDRWRALDIRSMKSTGSLQEVNKMDNVMLCFQFFLYAAFATKLAAGKLMLLLRAQALPSEGPTAMGFGAS